MKKRVSFIQRRPFVTAVSVGTLYLLISQYKFVVSGDAWAEDFYEYVHGAIANGWNGFFYTGIAGYFNFIPKLLSYRHLQTGLN